MTNMRHSLDTGPAAIRPPPGCPPIDAAADRAHFPALADGLRYLDSAATSLTPTCVIDAVRDAMLAGGSAHRGLYPLAQRATAALEGARRDVAAALGGAAEQIVFTRSATEGLNLVAEGWARPRLTAGAAIVITRAAHHSNLLPWRRICRAAGAELRIAECDARGVLDLESLTPLLDRRVVAVALTHVSNVTGAIAPLDAIAALRRRHAPQAALIVDGAQALPHIAVHAPGSRADFYVFSGHKVCGPQGIGAVWAPVERWAEAEPLLVGGGAVLDVGDGHIVWSEGPARFEAGTANMPGAVGLAAGLAFLDRHRDTARSVALTAALRTRLARVPGVRLLGDPPGAVGAVSFVFDGLHPHDVGAVLAERGVAVRVGHHCARPLLAHFDVRSAIRASIGLHTSAADLDALVDGLRAARELLAPPETGRGEVHR